MDQKAETPKQMLGHALNTADNNSGTRRSPASKLSRSSGGSGSPILDYTRQNQREALESRTATKIKELMQERERIPHGNRGGSSEARVGGRNRESLFETLARNDPDEVRDGVMHSSSMGTAPSTDARKNVTQRRSRGRLKDDGDSLPAASLLARRPRSRSKDRRYSIESTGDMENCERQDWRSANARILPYSPGDVDLSAGRSAFLLRGGSGRGVGGQMTGDHHERIREAQVDSAYRVPSSTKINKSLPKSHHDGSHRLLNPTAPFPRENIPNEEINPELHHKLTQLWYQRQNAVRGLGDALASDDLALYSVLMDQINELNDAMHREWQADYAQEGELKEEMSQEWLSGINNVPVQSSEETSPLSSSSSQSPQSAPKYLQVDSLPLSEPKERKAKQSFKDTGEGPFILTFGITLTYQGIETWKVVSDTMPLRTLFLMAKIFLQTDFGLNLQGDEDISLEYENQDLPRHGVLVDVPVLDLAVIYISFHRSTATPRPKGSAVLNNQKGRSHQASGQSHVQQKAPRSPINQADESRRGYQGDQSPHNEEEAIPEFLASSPAPSLDPRSYDKIRQSFRCPRFSGQAREWKAWDKGFLRYLSIWELDYVLDPEFFDIMPLTPNQRRDNKLVYYVIEDAVQGSPLASSYVRQVSINNGFEAYYTLHDGYVFAGATTATLLLNELSNFRFLPNETPTELCLRLEELFQELKLLPGDAAVTFIDTQQIGYLLNALRHEKEWDHVCSTITSKQIQGNITFKQACDELKVRCEATRAHELMDRPIKGKRVKGLLTTSSPEDDALSEKIKGLITSMSKRHNTDGGLQEDTGGAKGAKKDKKKGDTHECLAADCGEMTSYPLCPLHYHSLISAKIQTLKLRNGYGDAHFDKTTSLIVYPPRTPSTRLPTKTKTVSALAASPQ
jgi:hypothetical protein